MSGRKQHYIPQCLLKGFAVPDNGKIGKVWVFKKGQKPYLSTKQDVAAQRYFYSELPKDGSETLDDKITNYERNLDKLLIMLREAPVDQALDPTVAAEVVTHLTIRGAYLRDMLSFGMNQLLTGTANIFTDEESVRTLLGINANIPAPVFQEEIEKTLSEYSELFKRTGLPEPVLRQMIFTLAKENFGYFYPNQSEMLMTCFKYMMCHTSNIARDAHNKALDSSISPEARMAILIRFIWKIVEVTENNLILPDCVAVSTLSDYTMPEPHLMKNINTTDYVLLPICANKLLVGYRMNSKLPDVQHFNKLAAICSHTFFVSNYRTTELEKLAERISERTQATVLDGVNRALNEFAAKSSVVEHQPMGLISAEKTMTIDYEHHNSREIQSVQRISCIINFIDCFDQETAQKIADAVKVVVHKIAFSIPFQRLDRIIFAEDYTSTLQNLDRGFSASAPLVPTETDSYTGIAMTPLVLHNGAVKVCIVMQAWLGQALIGDNSVAQNIAIHTLTNQLAHVACVDLIDQALPGFLLNRVDDDWEAWLYNHMHPAWTAYFAARHSASCNPIIGKGYLDILLTFLNKIQEVVPRERLAYRFHGDLDRFLKSAISAAGNLLTYAATLLGHYDGLCQSVYDDEGVLAHVLEKNSLRGWFDSFQRDFASLFERSGDWKSVQEFLSLNRHIERILWQFGVFPWRNELGQVRVEIPLYTDAAKLSEHVNIKHISDIS